MTAQPAPSKSAGDPEAEALSSATGIVETACASIRAAILSGRFPPGRRLKVAELAAELGTSPMPLREALRKLEGEGLIEIAPNRGATVRLLDDAFVQDLFELNTELRVMALRRGAHALTLDRLNHLSDLAQAFAKANSAGRQDEALRLNREFSTCLVAYGGNAEALRVFTRGWELIAAYRQNFGYGPERLDGMAEEMRLIVEALGRGDTDRACALIRMQHAAVVEDLMQRLPKPL